MRTQQQTITRADGSLYANLTLFKTNRGRIICYMYEYAGNEQRPGFITVNTGRPCDPSCVSWKYRLDEKARAEGTAREYFKNFTAYMR